MDKSGTCDLPKEREVFACRLHQVSLLNGLYIAKECEFDTKIAILSFAPNSRVIGQGRERL